MKARLISEKNNREWSVYILRCSNDALYTGVTTDVDRRVTEHCQPRRTGARYTRAFVPVELAYHCRAGSKRLAYRSEYRIKKLPRTRKLEIVAQNFSLSQLLEFLGLEG